MFTFFRGMAEGTQSPLNDLAQFLRAAVGCTRPRRVHGEHVDEFFETLVAEVVVEYHTFEKARRLA
ncbi:hypothetical protein CPER28S_00906 [Cellulomonas persica]